MSERATRARQQQLARWARRAPGYRAAVEHLLPAVRRNAVLTDVVFRVFLPRHGVGTLPVPLASGHHLAGRDTALLPVVGVLGLGLTPEQVATLVEDVAALQRAEGSFRVLLVLDQPAFAAARRHGYVVEVLVPRTAWDDHPQADRAPDDGLEPAPRVSWDAYVGRRLADIVDHYQLWHLARASSEGHLDPLDAHLVRAVAARLPEGLQVSSPTQPPSDPTGPPPTRPRGDS